MNVTFIFDPSIWLGPTTDAKEQHPKWYLGTLELPDVHACLSPERLMERMWRYWNEWLEDESEDHLNMCDFIDWLMKNRGWRKASNHSVAIFNWPPMKHYAEG
jgi:hypothetical protein